MYWQDSSRIDIVKPMGKIVAIGGGETGKPGYPVETPETNREIIRLSGKPIPRLLFIPTATSGSELYCSVIKSHFGGRLGCDMDILYLLDNSPPRREIEEKILSSDIIYVGGGNTLKMMIAWRKQGGDKVLEEAYMRGIVLSGLSAGAICWFKQSSSDSRKYTNPEAGLIKVSGLNFINALCFPHYHTEEARKPHLRELIKKTPGTAIAIDNCCAIEIVDDGYRIISSKSNAGAYKVYFSKGEFHEELIEQKTEFSSIGPLLSK
ncbi:MAG: peptidase E [Dehalococcoidales bacterium]|nr:peptidase E [Dehalococcoidales bacterium]